MGSRTPAQPTLPAPDAATALLGTVPRGGPGERLADRRAGDTIVRGAIEAERGPMAGIELRTELDGDVLAVTGSDGSFELAVGDCDLRTVTLYLRHRGVHCDALGFERPARARTTWLGTLRSSARRIDVDVLGPDGAREDAVVSIGGDGIAAPGGVLRGQWVPSHELGFQAAIHDEAAGRRARAEAVYRQIPAQGSVEPVELRCRATGLLRVTVRDEYGTPAAGAVVSWEHTEPAPSNGFSGCAARHVPQMRPIARERS